MMRAMRRILILLLCLSSWPLQAETAWDALLGEGRYAEASARLKDLDRAYREGSLPFRSYDIELDALAESGKALEPNFDAWLKASGENAVVRMARGLYLMDRGWEERGGGYEVSPEQRKKMLAYFKRAVADLEEAAAQLPTCEICYAALLGITKPGPGDAVQIYHEAEKKKPGSPMVALAYLDSMDPRWGGSEEEGRRFVESFAKKYPDSPTLPRLRAGLLVWEGDAHYYKKAYGLAAEIYGRAIALDEDRSYTSFKLAYALTELRRYEEALKWFEHSLALRPRFIAALSNYARALLQVGRGPEAQAAFTRAVALGDAWALRRGMEVWREGLYGIKPDPAVTWALCNEALRAKIPEGYACMGGHYWFGRHVKQDHAEAVKWFRQAADAGLAESMVDLGIALWRGQGVAKDEAQAIIWWRKASALGEKRGEEQLRANLSGWRYFWDVSWQDEVDDTAQSWDNMKRSLGQLF